MKRNITILLLLLFLLPAAVAETITGRILWVYDGDTVILIEPAGTWRKIRLWGIDAPETNQPYGREAAAELIDLVGRKRVKVEIKDVDRYGRTVGVIHQSWRNVNYTMVRRGAAWHYVEYAPDCRALKGAETYARKRKLGLWKSQSPVPPWIWRKEKAKSK